MIITAEDILAYSYCPMLLKKHRKDIVLPRLSLIEETLKEAFIDAEREACLKDSITDPRRILCAWEKIWWRKALENNIKLEDADKISLNISDRFSEYCRYNISDWTYPTVGVNINKNIQVNSAIVSVHADILKVNLEINDPNLVIINFSNRVLSPRLLSIDPYVLSTIYGFYSGEEKQIMYISININESKKLSVTSSIYSNEEIKNTGIQFKNICTNIYNKNYYYNPFLCEGCKICQSPRV